MISFAMELRVSSGFAEGSPSIQWNSLSRNRFVSRQTTDTAFTAWGTHLSEFRTSIWKVYLLYGSVTEITPASQRGETSNCLLFLTVPARRTVLLSPAKLWLLWSIIGSRALLLHTFYFFIAKLLLIVKNVIHYHSEVILGFSPSRKGLVTYRTFVWVNLNWA